MIVVRIVGGLGNQFFQYATGRHLSLATGQRLRLALSPTNTSGLGRFDLERYNIVASVASSAEERLFWGPVAELIGRLPLPTPARRLHRVFLQRTNEFDPAIPRIRRGAYLVGYWQYEGFFSPSSAKIREELTLKEPPKGRNAELLRDIETGNSVAVHVRRGDFVSDARFSPYYNICDAAYYERAKTLLEERVRAPRYYVFSDDLAWCRANLGFLAPATFVDANAVEDRHEDLRLMSGCRHFIIANSSFSWWGAWMGRAPDKLVFAPETWTASFKLDDVLLPDWVRVPVTLRRRDERGLEP